MSRAQRMYDNQTPEDGYNELPDELYEDYKKTQEFEDWIMEEAGNGDWVAWEEQNYDAIYERATEYWNDQYAAAADDYADQLRDSREGW